MNTLESSLAYHLQCNHYPPVPLSMIPVCVRAIDIAVEHDGYVRDMEVDLPEGTFYRGQFTAPVYAIIEQHHLDAYVDSALNGHEYVESALYITDL